MPPTRRQFTFLVTVEVEAYTSEADTMAYVKEAVAAWRGCLTPPGVDPEGFGDPCYDLEVVDVRNAARVLAKRGPR